MLKKTAILLGLILLLPMNAYAAGIKTIAMPEMSQTKIIALAPLTIMTFLERHLQEIESASFKVTALKQDKPGEKNKTIGEKLAGQLNIGKSRIELPNPKGHNIYKITVKGGKAKLCHYSYNPDGHTWSVPPRNKQAQYINITDAQPHSFEINIDETDGQRDKVFLVNPRLWGFINVQCVVSKG